MPYISTEKSVGLIACRRKTLLLSLDLSTLLLSTKLHPVLFLILRFHVRVSLHDTRISDSQ